MKILAAIIVTLATLTVSVLSQAPLPELAPMLARRAKLAEKYHASLASDKVDDEAHAKLISESKKVRVGEAAIKSAEQTHEVILSARKIYYDRIKAKVIYINECMDAYTKYIAELPAEEAAKVRQSVAAKRWFIGMKKVIFRVIKEEPDKINTTTTASGEEEQWVYEGGNYFYFAGDTLKTVQD